MAMLPNKLRRFGRAPLSFGKCPIAETRVGFIERVKQAMSVCPKLLGDAVAGAESIPVRSWRKK